MGSSVIVHVVECKPAENAAWWLLLLLAPFLLRALQLSNQMIPDVPKSRFINKLSLFGCRYKPVKELNSSQMSPCH